MAPRNARRLGSSRPLDAAELAAIRAGRAIRLEKAAAPELALPSCRRSLAELFATQREPR